MSIIGIDIGQSVAKGLVFNEEGKVIADSFVEYDVQYPQKGWMELESLSIKQKLFELLKELNFKTKKDPVSAISVSTFGESFVPIDKYGNILFNIICPGDTRSKTELKKILELFDKDYIYKITGLVPSYLYSLSKIIWIKEQFPRIFKRTYKFLLMEDLFYKLLGIEKTSISYSLSTRTMFFDLRNKKWSEEILDKLGIDKDKFSIPVQSGEIIGKVSSEVKKELGFLKDVIIVVGGHDQTCAALGAGAILKGSALNGVGTTECIAPVFDKVILNKQMMQNNFNCEHHILKDLFVTFAFNLTAGSIIKWYKNTVGFIESYNANKASVNFYKYVYSKLDFVPSSLYLLPYFGPSATPFFNEKSLGAILGLSTNTTASDILKAIVEGLVFEMKLNVDLLKKCGIKIRELRATGGGSRSDYWMQLKSNILGIPIYRMKVYEAGCLGAMMLAAVSTSIYKNCIEAISKNVKFDKEFYPLKTNLNLYLHKYEKYKNFYSIVNSFIN